MMGATKRSGVGKRRTVLAGALVMTTALATTFTVSPALAQQATASSPTVSQLQSEKSFNIPAQPLTDALVAFGQQSGIQVTVNGTVARNVAAPAVQGTMTSEQALRQILAGSGLTYTMAGSTVAIERPGEGTIVLDPVTVEGPRLRDSGRTEGTDSYASTTTTVGSKTPVTPREIPQSVSVVTRQRLDDKNSFTLQEALEETTGMRVENYDDVRAGFTSRGYTSALQRDGVSVQYSNLLEAAPDMAIYDRVEVIRGPAGLFQGAGEPGGTINLVRKKPLDHTQVKASALAGSWDTYRGEVDLSAPLTENGNLRGRFVVAYDDRGDFVDMHESRKPVLYGTLEGDLSENTTASVAIVHQNHQHDSFRGVPVYYTDGTRLDLPRHTNITTSWADAEDTQRELHLDLEHRFNNGIDANVNARAVERSSDVTEIYVNTAVDPATGNVDTQAYNFTNTQRDLSFDANVSIPTQAFGQKQKFILGGDYFFSRLDRGYGGGPTVTMNAFNPDYDISKPNLIHTTIEKNDTEQFGLYGQARIKPGLDWATIVLGGRETWWNFLSKDVDAGSITADTQINGQFTPYAGLILDVTPELSIYGSYTSIFKPQTSLTPTGGVVAPREGVQYEVGVKGEFLNGALMTHLAAYTLEDENRATRIDGCIGSPCFEEAGLVRSQGIEAEVSGEVLPGLQLLAGYAYTYTKYVDDPSNAGRVFSTNTPKHMANLSGRYSFRNGDLDGLTIGGGARAMSSYFYYDSAFGRTEQNGYALFDAFMNYKLTQNVTAQFTVNNIFDEVYYERLERASRNNRYGEPRSFMLTVRAEW